MKRLLIADDVATNLRLVSEVLKGEYEVITARSGEQALHIVESYRPDIILLDIGMPKMDGYTVMDKLKENPDTASIPIIFLTGDTSKEAEAKALQTGAMDYIRKPFEPIVLKSRIERALEISSTQNELEEISQKDAMTGLWNRTYVEDTIGKLNEESVGYFLMLDMDNFKYLNDTYGHIIGDKALNVFADTLRSILGEDSIIARIGGDEFVVYIKNQDDREIIRDYCRQIISQVEIRINSLINDTYETSTSVSIGVAEFPRDGKTFEEIYSAADKALYFVKQNGKRGYHYFQDDCRTISEISREMSLIDMEELRSLIGEHIGVNGAYQVEYEGFKRIYRFLSRFAERTGQNMQIVLFTLKLKDNCDDENKIEETMDLLENNISGLLRRADVATRYSVNQYVIILMDTNQENGMIAVRRVLDDFNYQKMSEFVEIEYDIQDI